MSTIQVLHGIDPVCSYLVRHFAVRPLAAMRAYAEAHATTEFHARAARDELRVMDGPVPVMVWIRYALQLAVWGLLHHAVQVFATFAVKYREEQARLERERVAEMQIWAKNRQTALRFGVLMFRGAGSGKVVIDLPAEAVS